MSLPEVLTPWADIIHPAALLLPRPSERDYNELKTNIQAHGMRQPLAIWVDERDDEWLLDGVGRLQVLVEENQPILADDNKWLVPTVTYRADRGDDPYELALSLNLARRHLSAEQKRQVIRDLREQRPELSDRAVARMAGVSPHTVASEREAAAEEEAREPQADTGGAIGEGYDGGTYGAGEDGDTLVDDHEPGEREPSPPEPQLERFEQSGRRARGRRPGEPQTRARRGADGEDAAPFSGTVLPSAAKAARVAEAKRCVKWLRLKVEDLLSKRRAA
jgi:hypothetical protein